MPATREYKCTRCKKDELRERLTAKRVTFTTMGNRSVTKKSRTTEWLCPDCLSQDPIWMMQKSMGLPRETV